MFRTVWRVSRSAENVFPDCSQDIFETFRDPEEDIWQRSKGGLSNGGIRPLSSICAHSSATVHTCGLLGPFVKGTFAAKWRQVWAIVDNCGQVP